MVSIILRASDVEPPCLREVLRGLLDRALFGFLPGVSVGPGEARARVDVVNRAVVHVVELVGLDRHRPATEFLLTARIILRLHVPPLWFLDGRADQVAPFGP